METPSAKRTIIIIICLILSSISIAHFIKANYDHRKVMPLDFLIFIKAGKQFHKNKELYERVAVYSDRYHPAAVVYKFPPPFQLNLSPWFSDGKIPKYFAQYARHSMIAMYVFTVLLLFQYLRKAYSLHGVKSFIMAAGLLGIACWFMPYYECIDWILTEIPLLLAFMLSFLTLQRWPHLSGALIAYSACIKIYPAFLFLYHLIQKRLLSIPSLIGFIGTALITFSISIMYFGLSEHLFYVKKILPILLNEPVTNRFLNLNLETFLYYTGLIEEVDGFVFQAIRAILIGITITFIYNHKQYLSQKSFLFFSMLVCSMFFCFPNYWPQYQIYLLIPFSCLIAEYLTSNKAAQAIGFTTLAFIFAILCANSSDWKIIMAAELPHITSYTDLQLVVEEIEINGHGSTLFKYNPKAWLSFYFFEMRALAPLALWGLLLKQLTTLRHAPYRAASDLDTSSFTSGDKSSC